MSQPVGMSMYHKQTAKTFNNAVKQMFCKTLSIIYIVIKAVFWNKCITHPNSIGLICLFT